MPLSVEVDEFIKFMSQSSLADRFVAICVAGAFIEFSDSIVKGCFLPLVELVVPASISEKKFWVIRRGDSGGPYPTVDKAREDGALVLTYGKAVRAGLVFLLQGLIIFITFRLLSKAKHLPGAAGNVGARLDDALPTSRA